MNKVKLHKHIYSVRFEDAKAGSICEIVESEASELEGNLCIKPYCTNQAVVILNKNIASSDITLGIRRVRPLSVGESFTVTIGN